MIQLNSAKFDLTNFDEVEPGATILFYYQNFNIAEGKWKMSCFSAKDRYKVQFGQIYRKPKTALGWVKIMPQLIKKVFR